MASLQRQPPTSDARDDGEPRQRLLIVSDLHMATPGGSYPDPFGEDAAFADALRRFADHVAPPARLVLLGDVVDLVLAVPRPRDVCGTDGLAVAKLAAIADAHPTVFAALSDVIGAGHGIDVVAGNHDAELLRPAVQDRFRALLGGAAVAFHPWVIHVPGVLYAEHGQQHHDINHVAGLADRPGERGEAPALSPAACMDALRVDLAQLLGVHGRGLGPQLVELACGLVAGRPGARSAAVRAAAGARLLAGSLAAIALEPYRDDTAYEQRLREHARELALPGDAVVAIAAAAKPTPASILRRLARATIERTAGRGGDRDGYMLDAARAIDDRLRAAGAATAFYAFGHTHVARDVPLRAGPAGPRYLNAGTWSTMRLDAEPGSGDRLRFIEIEHGNSRPPVARLRDGELNEWPVRPPMATAGSLL